MEIKSTFTIRELSFGEVLDVSFQLFKRLIWKFVGLYFILWSPIILIYIIAFAPLLIDETHSSPLFFPAILIVIPLVIVAFGLSKGATIYMTAERYLNRPPLIKPSIKFAWSRFWIYLGTGLLWGLFIWLGFLCLILPGLFFLLIFSFIFQIVFLENLAAIDAMRRCWHLFKANAGKIVGFFFMALFIQYAVAAMPQIVIFGLGILGLPKSSYIYITIVSTLTYMIFSFILYTYIPIVWTVLYFDSRCKVEAFDLEMLAKSLEKQRDKQLT